MKTKQAIQLHTSIANKQRAIAWSSLTLIVLSILFFNLCSKKNVFAQDTGTMNKHSPEAFEVKNKTIDPKSIILKSDAVVITNDRKRTIVLY